MRSTRLSLLSVSLMAIFGQTPFAVGDEFRSENFIAIASTTSLARRVAERAEEIRKDQAIEWLGEELAPWQDLCPIVVREGVRFKASGNTSFVFRNRQPRSWRMSVRGTTSDILKTVLPHEVMHTVLASHFGCPLPRWADEGVCVMVEIRSTQERLLRKIGPKQALPIDRLFTVDQYPDDILLFYAQGFSVTRFLIDAGGKRKFIRFLGDGLHRNNWRTAVARHYGYDDYGALSSDWRKASFEDSPSPTIRRVVQMTTAKQ